MGGLRSWRHIDTLARPFAGRAITDGVDVVIPRRLQRRLHDQLIDAIGLEAIDVLEKIGRLDTRRPHPRSRTDELAGFGSHPLAGHLHHLDAQHDIDAETAKLLQRGTRESLRQTRQQGRRSFQDMNLDVGWLDVIQAIGIQQACRLIKLCRQLDAGGSTADDGNIQFARLAGSACGLCSQIRFQQPILELLSLLGRIEKHAVLGNAGYPEIVADTAHCHYKNVVRKGSLRHDLFAACAEQGCEPDLLSLPVQTVHATQHEAKMVVAGLSQVFQLIIMRVECSGRYLMQQGLPDMRPAAVDQRNFGPTLAAQSLA